MSDNTGFGVMMHLTLNDLKGGNATATLYRQQNGAWVPVGGGNGSMTYDGTDTEDVFSRYLYDVSMYDYFDSDSPVKYNAKIVVDYTYPDGTTGTLESGTFLQCAGNYAKLTALNIAASNAMLTAEVSVNLSMVDMAHLTCNAFASYVSADFSDSYNLSDPQLVSSDAAGDGTQRMVFQLQLTNPPAGTYYFNVEFLYNSGNGPKWLQVVSGQITY